MPTYGYECTACKNQFETIQSIKDEPLTTCDSCGGTLRKRIYPVGIAFKGSGFYVNDYGKPAPKAETGGGTDAKAVPSSAESKPEPQNTAAPNSEAPQAKTPAQVEKPASESKVAA